MMSQPESHVAIAIPTPQVRWRTTSKVYMHIHVYIFFLLGGHQVILKVIKLYSFVYYDCLHGILNKNV